MTPRSKAPQVQKRMDATMENPLKKKQRSVPPFTPMLKNTWKGKDVATQSTPKVNPLNPRGQTYQKMKSNFKTSVKIDLPEEAQRMAAYVFHPDKDFGYFHF